MFVMDSIIKNTYSWSYWDTPTDGKNSIDYELGTTDANKSSRYLGGGGVVSKSAR
jgi:hypothetical protein